MYLHFNIESFCLKIISINHRTINNQTSAQIQILKSQTLARKSYEYHLPNLIPKIIMQDHIIINKISELISQI